eukprot:1156168-Pelagomonas_calceolata.AAC.8
MMPALIYGMVGCWGLIVGNAKRKCLLLQQAASFWNTAARVQLNNQSPTWLQGSAKDILEAKWFAKNVRNDPILIARHAVIKEKERKKSMLAKRPHALRKRSLTSKLERVSPKGSQTYIRHI